MAKKTFMIYNDEGSEMGAYQAASAAEAIDSVCRDAGYADLAAACAVLGDVALLRAREIPTPKMRKLVFSGGFHHSPPITLRAAVLYGVPELSEWQKRKLDRHFCPSRDRGCLCKGHQRATIDIY